jgi:methionyl-tRNA synthetase
MPQKARALWAQLGAPMEIDDVRVDSLAALDPSGWRVTKGEALFPKAEARQGA